MLKLDFPTEKVLVTLHIQEVSSILDKIRIKLGLGSRGPGIFRKVCLL